MEVTLFLVNGKLVSKVSKGVVPEAFLFATDGREYLVPLLEKVPFRLTYRDAVGQAEEIEILKCPCSLMPGNDLEALLKNIVEINNMRKGFGLKEIPTSTSRFWAAKTTSDKVGCPYVVLNNDRVGHKFTKGEMPIAGLMPVLALGEDLRHRLEVEQEQDTQVSHLAAEDVSGTTQPRRRGRPRKNNL